MTNKVTANNVGQSAQAHESAAVRVLLTGAHQPTLQMLSGVMRARGLFVETCPVLLAITNLCRAKYEGLFVDISEGEQALETLRDVRTLTSNKGVVCCAILNHRSEMAAAFRAGANFALERPLDPEVIHKTLEAAYPMMLLERRRYYRCSIQFRMRIIRQDGSEHEGVSINLSEGGMAFDSSMILRTNESVQVEFQLPGEKDLIVATGMVCWAQTAARAGIQFTEISAKAAIRVQKWIADRVYELTPASS